MTEWRIGSSRTELEEDLTFVVNRVLSGTVRCVQEFSQLSHNLPPRRCSIPLNFSTSFSFRLDFVVTNGQHDTLQ